MHRGTEGGSFGGGKTNDWYPENVRTDLTPDPALAASSG
jgi:hypothetical protein